MKLLVLGGTKFLGRALTEAALGRGHRVTLLNRGRTNPGLYPGVETVHADRAGDLSVLSGRRFDAVLDVAGYDPEVVRHSATVLHGAVDRYVFVSTVSVYADHDGSQAEGEALLPLTDDTPPDDAYGARKAASEAVVEQMYGGGALVVRPGLIVGPHDPTDRFAYWPRRIARGGTILAPGHPHDPQQFIDVRDLAAFILDATTAGLAGAYNATGEIVTMGAFLDACRTAVSAAPPSTLVWVDDASLRAAGADPWMGVPLWIGEQGWSGANRVEITKGRAAGLTFRPVVDTIRDTLAWDLGRGGPPEGEEGLSEREEARLLAT